MVSSSSINLWITIFSVVQGAFPHRSLCYKSMTIFMFSMIQEAMEGLFLKYLTISSFNDTRGLANMKVYIPQVLDKSSECFGVYKAKNLDFELVKLVINTHFLSFVVACSCVNSYITCKIFV